MQTLQFFVHRFQFVVCVPPGNRRSIWACNVGNANPHGDVLLRAAPPPPERCPARKPNHIQLSFIRIVAILEEVRKYAQEAPPPPVATLFRFEEKGGGFSFSELSPSLFRPSMEGSQFSGLKLD